MPNLLASLPSQIQNELMLQTQLQNNQTAFGARDQSVNTMTNPQSYSSFIKQMTQPLSRALTNNITEQTAPSAAGAGLGQSAMLPYIMAQALAPSNLQEQQLGIQSAESGLLSPEMLPISYPTASSGATFGTTTIP